MALMFSSVALSENMAKELKMSIQGILYYTARALRFAALAELVWLACCLLCSGAFGKRSRKELLLQGLLIFYLAALVQITVIRGGIGIASFLAAPHDGSTVQPVPLYYTLQQARTGWWAVVYPVCGNLLWFLPLGLLLPQLWPKRLGGAAVGAAALLLSGSIEVLQWLFGSGVSDVDDVLFNVTGAWLGWRLWTSAKNFSRRR